VERKRILVVDDEKNIRFTVVHSLKSDDIQVDSASNGVEGVQMVGTCRYDLLLVDLRMPGMNGIEMLREIRRICPDLPPAVIITAYGIPQQLLEAAELGAIDYIRKPFSIQTIRAIVRDIFDRVSMPDDFAPQTANDYLGLARRAIMTGKREESHSFLRKVLELEPSMTDAHILLGILALLKPDYNQARDCFRHVLHYDPTNKTASEYLAWIAEVQP
jgi:CheY-like chemotaxis protein